MEEKGLPPSRLMMQEEVMHHGQPGRVSVRRKLKFKHQAGAQEHGGGIGSHAGPEGRSQQFQAGLGVRSQMPHAVLGGWSQRSQAGPGGWNIGSQAEHRFV